LEWVETGVIGAAAGVGGFRDAKMAWLEDTVAGAGAGVCVRAAVTRCDTGVIGALFPVFRLARRSRLLGVGDETAC